MFHAVDRNSGAPPFSAPPGVPAASYGNAQVRRGAGVGAFLLAIVTAGALAHVGVRIKGLQVAYDLGSERRISTDLEEQRRRLQIEIGMLKDPGRVIAIAREKLNMGPPAAEAIKRLGSATTWEGPDRAEAGGTREALPGRTDGSTKGARSSSTRRAR